MIRDEPPHRASSPTESDSSAVADDASVASGTTVVPGKPATSVWGRGAPAVARPPGLPTVASDSVSSGPSSRSGSVAPASVKSAAPSAWGRTSNTSASSGNMYLSNGTPADGGWGGIPVQAASQQPRQQQGSGGGGSQAGSAWGSGKRGGQAGRGGGGGPSGRGRRGGKGGPPSERGSHDGWDTSSVKAW
jgi:hypothetical protein